MNGLRRWAVVRGTVLALAVLCPACVDSPAGVEQQAVDRASIAGLERKVLDQLGITGMESTQLQQGIAHYTFDLPVAPGPYGTVRLHRLVKEQRPGNPVRTTDAIFLLTGAWNTAQTIYIQPLISPGIPRDQSIAIFLAENDIDVWTMDFGWALVPGNATDFGFMRNWGLGRDIQDVQKAISTIRSLRVATGQGNGRLNLLGFSYSVPIVYAIAGDETRLPPGQRSIKGVMAMDTYIKVDDATVRDAACAAADVAQQNIDAGSYQDGTGPFLVMVGDLAKSAPNDPSPVVPEFTNLQFALFVGANDDGGHFVGGYFDELGIPTGLRFTDPALWLDVLHNAAAFVPTAALRDFNATVCDRVDVPFDDHLGDIPLPILYVGSAGCDGPWGFYSTTLTKSTDVTHVNVQLLSDAEHAYDFGHADLFTASNAESLVWRPILNWLLAHHANS